AAAAKAAQMFTIVNPNNPTGNYVDETTAAAIATMLAKTHTPLIADEVFFPFTLDDTPKTLPRLANLEGVVTFSLDGLSKLLAAPGLKLGWIRLTGPAALTSEYARSLDLIADSYLAVGSPIALALPALLDHADAAVVRIKERLAANLSAAQNIFSAASGLRVRYSAGGWMALIDTPPLTPGTELAYSVLRQGQIFIHPGWFYDLDSPRALALSLLPEPTSFAASCHILREVIESVE
ncbi:MAG: pyridoxal phosphate-dependent aminotransferase, partial [Propionibacteriaceae bacterium]|nr:pyridoxal phosphate-dependent aminotransferase [Propionibacteriaceae bacterium]